MNTTYCGAIYHRDGKWDSGGPAQMLGLVWAFFAHRHAGRTLICLLFLLLLLLFRDGEIMRLVLFVGCM